MCIYINLCTHIYHVYMYICILQATILMILHVLLRGTHMYFIYELINVCMFIYSFCMYVYIDMFASTYVYIHIYMHMHICIKTYNFVCINVYTRISLYVYTFIYVVVLISSVSVLPSNSSYILLLST
jgi:hypothetical protein